jgi:Rad52/22 family double-strand break repair protein
MALSDTQLRQLKAKLDPRHVKTRKAEGIDLHYVEGWHAVSEANRIFGFDAWDRRTLLNTCVFSGTSGGSFVAVYTAKVRISVRAGDVTIVRDGSGSGEGKGATRGQAHDLALKAAETDATKRALSTFGNPFGLALYDPERAGVRKTRRRETPELATSWTLQSPSGEPEATFDNPSEFAAALQKAMGEAADMETLFVLWEQNVDAVRSLSRTLRQEHLPKSGIAPQLVRHLKRCAVDLAAPRNVGSGNSQPATVTSNGASGASRPKVDKSVLTNSEPKRIRCKEHLRFVATQPCIICGRQPSHAHHLRHAQSRGVGLKVSDEFTVPLCAIHHNEVHRVGREEAWWRERSIEPMGIAQSLWQQSLRSHSFSLEAAAAPTSKDDQNVDLASEARQS